MIAEHNEDICSKYASFVAKICLSIKQHVKVEDLHSHLINLPALISTKGQQCKLLPSEELKNKTSVNEIFDFISTSSADFLHYDIFAEIVESFGSKRDHELLNQYSKSVMEYVNKHKVAEFIPDSKGDKKAKKALFKTDMNLLSLKLSKIGELEKNFAQILDLRPSAFRFYSIEEGDELAFLVPVCVANEVFKRNKKMTEKQIADFQALSVKFIKCGGFNFNFEVSYIMHG